MARASYFSKLDAAQGFWQIQLDEESSRYCTFNTPYDRYKCKKAYKEMLEKNLEKNNAR